MTAFDEGVRAGIAKTAAMDKEAVRAKYIIDKIRGAAKKVVDNFNAGEDLYKKFKGKGAYSLMERHGNAADKAVKKIKQLKEKPDWDVVNKSGYSHKRQAAKRQLAADEHGRAKIRLRDEVYRPEDQRHKAMLSERAAAAEAARTPAEAAEAAESDRAWRDMIRAQRVSYTEAVERAGKRDKPMVPPIRVLARW